MKYDPNIIKSRTFSAIAIIFKFIIHLSRCHSVQVVRSIPQHIPDIFVLLLYVHEMPDVYDTLLQEFGVVRFCVEIYLHSLRNQSGHISGCFTSFVHFTVGAAREYRLK